MRRFLSQIKNYLALLIIKIFNTLPINNNKIFMFSYYGSQYGCNPKYITEYILNHDPNNQFDIVWAFNDPKSRIVNPGVRLVKTMSIKYFYELCTAKVIITNFRTTELFIKRKDQCYIQTWHSSLRLKQIEKDAEALLPTHYVEMAKKDSKKCDYLLSGCKYSTTIFKRAFWYDGEILEYGTPRNDILFNNSTEKRKEILANLNLPENQKVILYAPTFRKNTSLEFYKLNYSEILEGLSNKFGGEWTFLVKLHPHMISSSKQLTAGENVQDVTAFDDIQELLSIADVLITDYSSLMFDYCITGRPCFLYVPDFNDYIEKERELYFSLLELPFAKAYSPEDLLLKMNDLKMENYKVQLKNFISEIESFEDGRACEKLAKLIDQVCFGINRGEVYEAV
jgi:CDP-glycerol glycerophosphotransferase